MEKAACHIYREVFQGAGFQRLAAAGAQSQRLLWASTSTKNPTSSDVKYVDIAPTGPAYVARAFGPQRSPRAHRVAASGRRTRRDAAGARCVNPELRTRFPRSGRLFAGRGGGGRPRLDAAGTRKEIGHRFVGREPERQAKQQRQQHPYPKNKNSDRSHQFAGSIRRADLDSDAGFSPRVMD